MGGKSGSKIRGTIVAHMCIVKPLAMESLGPRENTKSRLLGITWLGAEYADPTIAYESCAKGQMPSDTEIEADIEARFNQQ